MYQTMGPYAFPALLRWPVGRLFKRFPHATCGLLRTGSRHSPISLANEVSHRGIYTTELSKGQGAIDETLTLLKVWEPGIAPEALARKILTQGVLSRSTAVRTR